MPVNLGAKAPDFILQDTEGHKTSLSDFKGKNIVLLFFPLAFSSVCTEELCKTRDNLKFYESTNAKVIGISVDSFFTLKEFKKLQNLNFTLLSDFNKETSSDYEVLYQDYFGMKGVSKRSVFVINKEGIVKHKEILENSGELPNFKALQHTLTKIG